MGTFSWGITSRIRLIKAVTQNPMDYLLDTNLIIIYSRESRIAKKIEDDYDLFDDYQSSL